MAKKAGRAQRKVAKKATPKATKQIVKSAPIKPHAQIPQAKKAWFFNLNKAHTHPGRLPNSIKLLKITFKLIWDNRKLFIGLTLIYGLLNLILVQGLSSSTDVSTLKSELSKVFTGDSGAVLSGLSVFAVLVSSAGNGSSQTAGAYQLILAIVTSLAVIWSLRQLMSGHRIRIRDAFYKGMYPLIPFIFLLLLVAIELIPLIIGASLYSTVISNGIAITIIEKAIWLLIFLGLAGITLYLLSVSFIALYIVTLPDMTPIKALRSAKNVVKYRRWTVIRKIIAMPICLLIISAIIMLPIIIWLTVLAQWVFFLMTMFALVVVNSYMYVLYREMLNEDV